MNLNQLKAEIKAYEEVAQRCDQTAGELQGKTVDGHQTTQSFSDTYIAPLIPGAQSARLYEQLQAGQSTIERRCALLKTLRDQATERQMALRTIIGRCREYVASDNKSTYADLETFFRQSKLPLYVVASPRSLDIPIRLRSMECKWHAVIWHSKDFQTVAREYEANGTATTTGNMAALHNAGDLQPSAVQAEQLTRQTDRVPSLSVQQKFPSLCEVAVFIVLCLLVGLLVIL